MVLKGTRTAIHRNKNNGFTLISWDKELCKYLNTVTILFHRISSVLGHSVLNYYNIESDTVFRQNIDKTPKLVSQYCFNVLEYVRFVFL